MDISKDTKDFQFDFDEVKRALKALGLQSIIINDYLVTFKSEFDATIKGEPYVALMLLFNMRLGLFMAREELLVGFRFTMNYTL